MDNFSSFTSLLQKAERENGVAQRQRAIGPRRPLTVDGRSMKVIVRDWLASNPAYKTENAKTLWKLFYDELKKQGFKKLKHKNGKGDLDQSKYCFLDPCGKKGSIAHKRFKNILSACR